MPQSPRRTCSTSSAITARIGNSSLARHPAGPECVASANAKDEGGTFPTQDGGELGCYTDDCAAEIERFLRRSIDP